MHSLDLIMVFLIFFSVSIPPVIYSDVWVWFGFWCLSLIKESNSTVTISNIILKQR